MSFMLSSPWWKCAWRRCCMKCEHISLSLTLLCGSVRMDDILTPVSPFQCRTCHANGRSLSFSFFFFFNTESSNFGPHFYFQNGLKAFNLSVVFLFDDHHHLNWYNWYYWYYSINKNRWLIVTSIGCNGCRILTGVESVMQHTVSVLTSTNHSHTAVSLVSEEHAP